MRYTILRNLAASALIVTSVACGGGDGSSTTPAAAPKGSAEGLWTGRTSTNRTIAGLVLDDGTYWLLYTSVGNSAVLGGAVQGTSTSTNGNFTSADGVDFNFEGAGINSFTFSGTYVQKSTLGGTLTAPGVSFTMTTAYDADYDLTPSLATIAGTYSGTAITAGGTDSATVTISGAGAITGSSALGCNFSGTGSVRAKGNVYDVSVTFAGGNCSNGTDTVTGVAYYDATTKVLTSTALNTARTNGFMFAGTKP